MGWEAGGRGGRASVGAGPLPEAQSSLSFKDEVFLLVCCCDSFPVCGLELNGEKEGEVI